MPRKAPNHYETRRKRTETRLRGALNRLISGTPTHQDLLNSNYSINVSILAREAGLSRQSIYTEHRGFLGEITQAQDARKGKRPPPLTASDKNAELRRISDDLRSDILKLATQNASLLQRATRAEDELDAARNRIDALQAKPKPK